MEDTVKPVVSCPVTELQAGKLGRLFGQGAKVAIVNEDDRVRRLWDSLLEGQHNKNSGEIKGLNPWDLSVWNVGRNHFSGDVRCGDMMRFIPGGIAYIGRKIVVFQDSDKQFHTLPNFFYPSKRELIYDEKILLTVWDLMREVFESTLSQKFDPLKYAVTIELLKYYSSPEDLQNMIALLKDSGGPWTRIGMQLDGVRSLAAGVFNIRGARDLFALSSLVPGLWEVVNGVNSRLVSISKKTIPDDFVLIGDPHVDGTKVITALLSDRDVLRTDVYSGSGWVPLHLTSDALAIFPSAQIKNISKLSPTWHRILLKKNMDEQGVPKPNITISLTIIPRSQNILV